MQILVRVMGGMISMLDRREVIRRRGLVRGPRRMRLWMVLLVGVEFNDRSKCLEVGIDHGCTIDDRAATLQGY
jgi:hypothetical protein